MLNMLGADEKIDFKFAWTPQDFSTVPKNVIDIASRLIEMGLISVEPELNEDGRIVINTLALCNTDHYFIDSMADLLVDKNDAYKFRMNNFEKLDFVCNRGESKKYCKLPICPIIVAGYMYYEMYKSEYVVDVKMTKKFEDLYNQNLLKVKEISINEQMEQIVLPLLSTSHTSFACCFQGEKGLGKLEKCNELGKFLFDLSKIKNKVPTIVTFDEFSELTYRYKCIPTHELVVITGLDDISVENNDSDFSEESNKKIKKRNYCLDVLSNIGNNHYIILMGDKETIDIFLASSPKLLYVFKDRVVFKDFTKEELFDKFASKINKKLKKDLNNFKDSFYKYIDENRIYLPFKNNDLVNFLSNKSNIEGKLILPETINEKFDLEGELKNFIGMEKLKEEIRTIKSYLSFRKYVENNTNNKLPDFNLHMLFQGAPGTGKTTFARVITGLLYDLGYIKSNKLIEVERKDLFAAYTGQSAIKTDRVIKKALGGVLFIDEAYSLAGNDAYSTEVIATLVKAMEDYKGNLIVIFAGYEKEMQEFINSNSGINSRIGYVFDFPDYKKDELYDIYELKIKKYGFTVDKDAKESVESIIRFFSGVENFGNGRFIDKLIQEIILKHSKNLKEYSSDTVMKITKDDIPTIKEMVQISLLDEDNIVLPSDISEEDKKIVTYHEIGHALTSYINEGKVYIKEITIVPEGTGTLGYVALKNKEPKALTTKKDYNFRLMSLLAGMAAEEIIFGNFSDGNGSDLKKATVIANAMVSSMGMSEKVGPININSKVQFGEYMKEEIDKEVQVILKTTFKETKELLMKHKDTLISLSEFLIQKGTLTGEEFEEEIKKYIKK